MFQHFLEEIGRAEARRFGADERAAEGKALARQHAVFVCAADFLIRAEEIAYLSAAHTHIAGGHVHVGTDVAVKFGHERVAEAHNFGVGLACGVEIAAALAAAHRKTREGIFESLLESEKFHHGEVDVGLETEPALVRSYRVIELHAEAAVHVPDAFVVLPRHTEDDLPVGFDHSFEDAVAAEELLVLLDGGSERAEHLAHRLHKFGFARILALCHFDDF